MREEVEQELLDAMARRACATGEVRRATLDPRTYTDPARLARETERALRAGWIPFARESELPEPGAHVSRTWLGDCLTVLRDGEGALRGLHDVCPHRGARILRTERGRVDELRCAYHDFRFDLAGRCVGGPKDCELEGGPGLPPARTARALGWVWVNPDGRAAELEAVLGADLLDELARWPLAELEIAWSTTRDGDFDWKVGVEAFLEPLHVPTIHPRSAHPVVDPRGMAWRALGDHSRMALPFRDPGVYGPDGVLGAAAREAGVAGFAGLNRAQRESHVVYHVFPCTIWMLLPNQVLSLRFLPTGPERCRLEAELLVAPPPPDADEATADRARAWAASLVPGYGRLLAEDLENLPWIQRGLRDATTERVRTTRFEERVPHFRDALERHLTG